MSTDIIRNPTAINRGCYQLAHLLSSERSKAALNEMSGWPGYAITPLRELNDVARECGISRVLYKDEGHRFGLGSFKALGGAYAVARVLQRGLVARLGRSVSSAELAAGAYRDFTQNIVVACATDGNHGRSVAGGARRFGCGSAIVVHSGVSTARQEAITELGATIIRVDGTYDDAVREAARLANQHGWELVSDTSSLDNTQNCLDIMHGYTVMAAEILLQLRTDHGKLPTHVFIQGGVGGLAASMCAYFWESLGAQAPIFIVVEPRAADCLYQSARTGEPTPASGDLNTVMAGLSCGQVSETAWPIVKQGVEFFMTIADAAAINVMRFLATRADGGRIVAGESAVAGLAGLMAVANDTRARDLIRLDGDSHVLVFGTEGATDSTIHEALTGVVKLA